MRENVDNGEIQKIMKKSDKFERKEMDRETK